MAAKPKSGAAKKRQPAVTETSQSIEEQTKAFLKAGGKVDYINSGVSGQKSLAGKKQISLGKPKSN